MRTTLDCILGIYTCALLLGAACLAHASETTATLTSPIKVPVVVNGRAAGSMTARAGTKVKVLKEEAGKTLVAIGSSQTWVDQQILASNAPAPASAVAPTPQSPNNSTPLSRATDEAWKAAKNLASAATERVQGALAEATPNPTPSAPATEAAQASKSKPPRPMGKGKYVSEMSYADPDLRGLISAVAMSGDDKLVVAATGKIFFFDTASGKLEGSFDTGIPNIATIAVGDDSIYVFAEKSRSEEVAVNGRNRKMTVPEGVTCKVMSFDGNEQRTMDFSPLLSIRTATIRNGELYTADYARRTISCFDAQSGQLKTESNLPVRLCCGIFHFAIDPADGDMLVSNLGAFKLQRYESDGNLKSEFGERGEADQAFHGCCNPVSSSVLPDGNLVVTEKDPSRVKIYSPDGQLLEDFRDLKELVAGCNRVLLASDSQGRIYLGVNSGKPSVIQYARK